MHSVAEHPAAGRARTVARLLVAGAVCALALTLTACSGSGPLTTPDGKPISTSTTRIASANVVSADRDLTRTCLAPTAPDPGLPDVARIVVTDPALLDAICALGLGPKVTAVTSAPGSIPAYLGPQLSSVPTIGTSPGAAEVRAASPDIVLTTPGTAPSAAAFRGVRSAPIGGDDWQSRFTSVAQALNRAGSADRLLTEFRAEATRTGTRMDAAHQQVSLVRFVPGSTGDGAEIIAGTDSFAGQILSLIGVQRPAPQRTAQSVPVSDTNFTDADGDLIYVSFDGTVGLEYGKQVMESDRWLDMGAPTWKRVLVVDDEIWYRTSGLAAAWLVLNDVKESLNGSSANY
ncbi:ABC transporter substrate-binding protein [Gordonia sinesedis]